MAKSKKTAAIIIIIALIVLCTSGYFFLRGYVEKKIYPLEYENYIMDSSEEFSLDPYFVCAVIKTESGFRKDAVSKSGAQGLMQVMPETADWIAQKLGISDYDIFDPQTNIRFGCWYLSFLYTQFSDENSVIAAYNAGHNRVSEWLKEGYSKDGKKLDDIPIEETKKYVDKVNLAYEKYKELYEIF